MVIPPLAPGVDDSLDDPGNFRARELARLQVPGRRLGPRDRARDDPAFVLLAAEDYLVTRAALLPVEIVREHARRRAQVNGDVVMMNSAPARQSGGDRPD